jgi:hypothetical protein
MCQKLLNNSIEEILQIGIYNYFSGTFDYCNYISGKTSNIKKNKKSHKTKSNLVYGIFLW